MGTRDPESRMGQGLRVQFKLPIVWSFINLNHFLVRPRYLCISPPPPSHCFEFAFPHDGKPHKISFYINPYFVRQHRLSSIFAVQPVCEANTQSTQAFSFKHNVEAQRLTQPFASHRRAPAQTRALTFAGARRPLQGPPDFRAEARGFSRSACPAPPRPSWLWCDDRAHPSGGPHTRLRQVDRLDRDCKLELDCAVLPRPSIDVCPLEDTRLPPSASRGGRWRTSPLSEKPSPPTASDLATITKCAGSLLSLSAIGRV